MALGVAKRSLSIKDADASPPKRKRSSTSAKTSVKKEPKKAARATQTKKTKATKPKTKSQAVDKQVSKKTKPARSKTTTANKTKPPAKKTKKTSQATPKAKKATKTTKRAKSATAKKATSPRSSQASPQTVNPKYLHVANPKQAGTANTPVTKRDRLGHLLLEQLLRNEGFKGMVATEKYILDEYSTDESIFSITPQLVLQPLDVQDVEVASRVVARETNRFASLSLTPRAAGTGLSGGSLTDSVVLDMQEGLTTIGELQYRSKSKDVLITAEAGVKWRDMAAVLARAGYHIPTYSTAYEICTVGGAIANNAAGAMSQRYGHCADFIESLDVVLHDGERYKVEPLSYKQLQALLKKKNALSRIAGEVFTLLEKEQKTIKDSKLAVAFNTAGYNIWDVLPQGVAAFKRGTGVFDLTKLLAGSQGTIGIVTSATLRAIPFPGTPTTVAVPIYNLADLPHIINEAKAYDPLQVEAFDAATYNVALKNPDYFKKHLRGLTYYRSMLAMYTTYHVRYGRRLPELILLIAFDQTTINKTPASTIAKRISTDASTARVLSNPIEEEVFWLIRRSSYDLARLQDERKRTAAFVEDMLVPIDALPKYITGIQKLCKEFNVQSTMYGHIGNGHLHLFPLLDFTDKTTPALIEKLSERFFSLATKHGGTISAEHNDGIIRTPHLDKLYSKPMVGIFEQLEAIFDPADIFNPGKKVNPRFVVRDVLRTTNY